MANVNIKFNGKEFLLSCDDGQEEHLEELLTHINEKFSNLKNDLGNIGENKLLLITSVQIMDEYFETKKKVDQKKNELKAKAKVEALDFSDDLDTIIAEEATLSDGFKEKASTIVEAVLTSKLAETVERLESEYVQNLEEEVSEIQASMVEKVDSYLTYVVEQWMKDNELALERGLKGEIAEDFIAGLKQLFEDHYVDIPDEKYDVLQAQSDKIAELEEKVNKTLDESMELNKSKDSLPRNKVISEMSSDLADTEIEKFKGLTEDVDFGSEEDFRSKLDTLKESYFPKTIKETTENIDNVETGPAQDIDVTDSMAAYSKAIGTAVKGASK